MGPFIQHQVGEHGADLEGGVSVAVEETSPR